MVAIPRRRCQRALQAASRKIDRVRLRTLYPFYCDDHHASHPPFALVRRLAATDLHAELWVNGRGPRASEPFVREALWPVPRRFVDAANRRIQPAARWTSAITERRFRAAFADGDAAWMHRGCSVDLMRRLRERGHRVFLERANTM